MSIGHLEINDSFRPNDYSNSNILLQNTHYNTNSSKQSQYLIPKIKIILKNMSQIHFNSKKN